MKFIKLLYNTVVVTPVVISMFILSVLVATVRFVIGDAFIPTIKGYIDRLMDSYEPITNYHNDDVSNSNIIRNEILNIKND